jgi:outer membrane protein assembly factor BamB
MRLARFLAVLPPIVALASTTLCAEPWTRFRGPNGSGVSTATTVPATWTDADYNWRVKLPGRITSPVVAGDTVYIASQEAHTLYALDRRKGGVRWTFRAGARIDSPPSVAGNTLYVGSRDGWVYALL